MEESTQESQPKGTSGIKKTWGILISFFLLVICGLAIYYSYLFLNFFGKQQFIPVIFVLLPLLVIVVIYFTIRMTWNLWFAIVIALILLLGPTIYLFYIYKYCVSCSQEINFVSTVLNYTRKI